MKIRYKTKLFKNLIFGEVCRLNYDSYHHYMKTEKYHDANCVHIETGTLECIDDEEEVIVVDCELLIN